MDVVDAPRRPVWIGIIAAMLVVIVGGGVLLAQVQARAREEERAHASRSSVAAMVGVASGGDSATGASGGNPAVMASDGEPVAPSSGAVPPVPAAVSVVSVDAAWAAATAGLTGIPERALRAYASAALTVQREQPSCGLGWNTLAGLGAIESGHGTHAGGALRPDGYPDPPIRGIALDGSESAAIADTDGGRFDGDAEWDRAVGPLQFIPATWERWGVDANGDGVADPNQIDDAALAAARYLCAAGEMTSAAGWRRAVFSYNHLDSYVDDVAATANTYARRAG